MLGQSATIETHCPVSGELLEILVGLQGPSDLSGVVHFAVPAVDWWQDIGYT